MRRVDFLKCFRLERDLSRYTLPSQIEPRINDNEEILQTPQSTRTEASSPGAV